jgi:hypothetical protein
MQVAMLLYSDSHFVDGPVFDGPFEIMSAKNHVVDG